jgi:hypothetical protein
MSTKFRSERIDVETEGSYVTVFQRPDEKPLLELNFFGERHTIPAAIRRQRALTKAVRLAKMWRAEDDTPPAQVQKPVTPQEAYIAALETYIYSRLTCVACECSLLPSTEPPRCDTCNLDEDAEPDWEEDPLNRSEDPVAFLRAKYGMKK